MEKPQVVLLGAAGGLGRAIAEALLAQGDRLWLLDLAEGREALDDLLQRGPGQASFVPLDLRDPASIASAFRVIAADTPSLDACINAAASFTERASRIPTPPTWSASWASTSRAPFWPYSGRWR